MKIDIKNVPFSTKGSYMAISWCPSHFRGFEIKEGLYLRSVHGNSRFPFVAELIPLVDGRPCDYEIWAEPYRLCIRMQEKMIELVFDDADTICIHSSDERAGLRLDTLSARGGFDFIQPVQSGSETWYLLNSFKSYSRYMLHSDSGNMELSQTWVEESSPDSVIDFMVSDGEMLVILQEVQDVWTNHKKDYEFEKIRDKAKKEYQLFESSMPSVPHGYEGAREIAAYVNYSSFLNPKGFIKRPVMLMSKNWMSKVWSWDHCFNALALAYHQPEAAWDQFMFPFDHQSPTGRIPDSVEDSLIIDNYCKPPIHGWTLHKLKKIMKLDQQMLEEAYEKLGRYTNWWLNYRDQDGDGLCEYTHGNDSGWDNSTAFSKLPPVITPDLAALLIVQMDELAATAQELGRESDAKVWTDRANAMLEKMLMILFDGDRPLSRQALTGDEIQTDSLILYLPVILGDRLPEHIRTYLVETLKSDKFLTEFGWATESPDSPYYVSDGYWRGPIWAPSTFLLLDGMNACGEKEFVRDVADRFCRMVEREGCAENFDALTGCGLRDRAYTWTGSAMLVIAHEYIESENAWE